MNADDKHTIRDYIGELLRDTGSRDPLEDGESLFASGRLSSFQMMMLVMHLEEKFGLNFGELEFDVSLIDSVNDIAALVARQERQP
jgi:acyl carrier protein